jgi:hypothetical protein
MRRLLIFAASFLLATTLPLCAQHGGGGHGGGGGSHGGFSGGGHASFGGSHGSVGGFAGHSSARSGFSGSRFGAGSRSFSGYRSGGVRIRNYGFRNRGGYGSYYGYPYYGYPLYAYGGIDPYWWWDTYSGDQDDAEQRQEAAEMNAENIEEQQALRQQDQQQNYGMYARRMPPPRPAAQASQEAEKQPGTILVYRDEHQREIQNYAISDGLLWNFTPQRTEKIPLAVLDIPATIKANEDRGVEFHLPPSGEGQ